MPPAITNTSAAAMGRQTLRWLRKKPTKAWPLELVRGAGPLGATPMAPGRCRTGFLGAASLLAPALVRAAWEAGRCAAGCLTAWRAGALAAGAAWAWRDVARLAAGLAAWRAAGACLDVLR